MIIIILVVFRWYLNYVSWVLSWFCLGDVSVIIRSWFHFISVMFRWSLSYVSVMSRFYLYFFLDDFSAWFWCCHALISVMSRGCSGDVLVMSRGCSDGVSVTSVVSQFILVLFFICLGFVFIFWWCLGLIYWFLGSILVIFYDFLGRICFGKVSVIYGDGIRIY